MLAEREGFEPPIPFRVYRFFKLSRFAGVSDPAQRESGRLQAKSRAQSREPEHAGGEGGIRTPDTLSGISVFQVEPFCRRERSRTAGERETAGEIPSAVEGTRTCWRRGRDSNPRYPFGYIGFSS